MIRWREIFWPPTLAGRVTRGIVYAVFAVVVLVLAGCAREQRAVVDPAAFSLWVVGF